MVHLLDLVPIELCLVRPILIASPFHDVIIWSGYTLPYVGTRELQWSARVPVTSSVEWHNGSTLPQESRARHARLAGRRGLIWFIWYFWFLWFIWLVWFNQTNETNQMNQMNQKRGLS